VTATALGVLAATLTGATLAHPATADPLSDAKAKAASLQATVADLQIRAEQASERYDAAEAALGALVDQQRAAQRSADAANRVLQQNRSVVNERARALYMSGGTLAMYANLLQNGTPTSLFAALQDVASLSNADHRMLASIDEATQQAKQAKARVDDLLQQQSQLMTQASSASADVEKALGAQQQALNAATENVRTLQAELQAKIDAQNAAQAAAAIAAARQLALAGGFVARPTEPVAAAAIAAAQTQLGKPYVYGGSGPDVWDCSGLTQWAYRQAGVNLPRTAAQQYLAVPTKVPLGQLEPGDLLFWATDTANPATIHHVAVYLGAGQMLAAPHTGTVVRIQPVYLTGYFGAVRPG
jgi:cell wall-associated NlpC family hydrolase